jgi:hypothetical protein
MKSLELRRQTLNLEDLEVRRNKSIIKIGIEKGRFKFTETCLALKCCSF